MRKRLLTLAAACTLAGLPVTVVAAESSQAHEQAVTTQKAAAQQAASNSTYYGNYAGVTVSVGARVRTGMCLSSEKWFLRTFGER